MSKTARRISRKRHPEKTATKAREKRAARAKAPTERTFVAVKSSLPPSRSEQRREAMLPRVVAELRDLREAKDAAKMRAALATLDAIHGAPFVRRVLDAVEAQA